MQMAAYELNCQVDDLELVLGDSLGQDAGSCDAARQMTFVGRASVAAALELREKILEAAQKELGLPLKNLVLEGKTVRNLDTGKILPLTGLGEIKGVRLANIPDKEVLMPGIPSHLYTTDV